MGFASEVNVSKEDYDIAGHLAVYAYAAKEAHGIMNGVGGGYIDVAAELDGVRVRMGAGSGEHKTGCHKGDKKSSLHS
jgi:hypothetical protein